MDAVLPSLLSFTSLSPGVSYTMIATPSTELAMVSVAHACYLLSEEVVDMRVDLPTPVHVLPITKMPNTGQA